MKCLSLKFAVLSASMLVFMAAPLVADEKPASKPPSPAQLEKLETLRIDRKHLTEFEDHLKNLQKALKSNDLLESIGVVKSLGTDLKAAAKQSLLAGVEKTLNSKVKLSNVTVSYFIIYGEFPQTIDFTFTETKAKNPKKLVTLKITFSKDRKGVYHWRTRAIRP